MLSELVNVVQIINSSRGNVDCCYLGFEGITVPLVQSRANGVLNPVSIWWVFNSWQRWHCKNKAMSSSWGEGAVVEQSRPN